MGRTCFLFALAIAPTTAQAKSNGNSYFEYVDILAGEVVGEIGTQLYDRSDGDHFQGTLALGGIYAGGGIGVRPVFRFPDGVRLSLETSAAWGRLHLNNSAFDFSMMTRAEFLTGLGWETTLGRILILHTETIIGLDAAWVNGLPRRPTLDAATGQPASGTAAMQTFGLSRTDLRLGQQVGLHLQLSNWIALYADGTLDSDGQWRARAGVALGRPVHWQMR
jgi:hypothetical protein